MSATGSTPEMAKHRAASRAELSAQREREAAQSVKAQHELNAATAVKMAKLRELRLAKEATDRAAAALLPPKAKPARKAPAKRLTPDPV